MTFQRDIPVMFRHCDPAGIIFYPRYIEMLNDTVEAFFLTIPGYSFVDMHPGSGVPTVDLKSQFHAPSFLGDVLTADLSVEKIGNTSVTFHLDLRCQEQSRMTADITLVYVNKDIRPTRWPDTVRLALQSLSKGNPS